MEQLRGGWKRYEDTKAGRGVRVMVRYESEREDFRWGLKLQSEVRNRRSQSVSLPTHSPHQSKSLLINWTLAILSTEAAPSLSCRRLYWLSKSIPLYYLIRDTGRRHADSHALRVLPAAAGTKPKQEKAQGVAQVMTTYSICSFSSQEPNSAKIHLLRPNNRSFFPQPRFRLTSARLPFRCILRKLF